MAFIVLAALRIGHPFALDASEGMWLEAADRLAQGQVLYSAPSLEYVPPPAMPGWAWVASWGVEVAGPRPWVPRAISLLSTLALVGLVARVVRAETESPVLSLTAVGLLLAGVAVAGERLLVGGPDATAWALAIGGLATLRFTTGYAGALLSGLLLSMALFTADHTIWFALAAALHLGLGDRRRLPAYVLALVATAASGYAWMASHWGPWFTFYSWEVAAHAHRPLAEAARMLLGRLVTTLGPLALSVLLAGALPTPVWRGRSGIWVWTVVAGVLATWTGAVRPATALGMGPALVALAIAGPVALSRVVSHLAAWPGSERAGRSWVLPALLILQFVPLVYPFPGFVSNDRDRQAHHKLVEHLRAMTGPVLVPGFGYVARQAGKEGSYHPLALDALQRSKAALADSMFAGLARETRPRSVVVSDDAEPAWLSRAGYEWSSQWRDLEDSPAPYRVFAARPRGPSTSDPGTAVPIAQPVAALDSTTTR